MSCVLASLLIGGGNNKIHIDERLGKSLSGDGTKVSGCLCKKVCAVVYLRNPSAVINEVIN